MKYIIIIAISLIEIDTFAQQIRNFNDIPQDILVNLNKMGRDTEIALNNYEAEFLNKIFENSRENFDFTNKKVVFIYAHIGIKSKKHFFSEQRKRFLDKSTISSCSLFILDKKQSETNKYDAIITCWFKFYPNLEKLIKKVRKNNLQDIKKTGQVIP
ncbi:hypothetical protein OL230_05845 [Capnocytophaga ochracea]|uniref:hypothetical protein n=1 Tax=Capnocytophaga ochracea TaxID=1018 RepID=UPI002231DC82|nr:hypothetical protein [Capnocytophaga ochracea]UZD39683.1 hypothetical protein OL230_05845 [Capnocytophaga ochracea]